MSGARAEIVGVEYSNEEADSIEMDADTVRHSLAKGEAWLKGTQLDSTNAATEREDEAEDDSEEGDDEEQSDDDDDSDDDEAPSTLQVEGGNDVEEGEVAVAGVDLESTPHRIDWADDGCTDVPEKPEPMPLSLSRTPSGSKKRVSLVIPEGTRSEVSAEGLFGHRQADPLSAGADSTVRNPVSFRITDERLAGTAVVRDTEEQWTVIRRQADLITALEAWKESMMTKNSQMTSEINSLKAVCDDLRVRMEELDRSALSVINQAQTIIQTVAPERSDVVEGLARARRESTNSIAQMTAAAAKTTVSSRRKKQEIPLF